MILTLLALIAAMAFNCYVFVRQFTSDAVLPLWYYLATVMSTALVIYLTSQA